MPLSRFFAADYFAARGRFRAATADDGFRREVHEIAARGPAGEALTIDAAILGSTDPRRVVVVSSGLHGVEGAFGSAVQLAWLERRAPKLPVPADAAVVLVHALNPFGFAWRRRWNENNVDLNRNFLDDRSFLAADGTYAESRRVYERLNSFLNPRSPQSPLEPYTLQALRHILAVGLESRARRPAGQRPPLLALKAVGALGLGELKKSLPVGQYEHRHGLFYGGDGPEQTTRIVQERLPSWVGRAETIIHVDFHTGLGAHGTYKHLLVDPEGSKRTAWLGSHLGSDVIEPSDAEEAYAARGSMAEYFTGRFSDRNYHCLTAEFGTYAPIRVLGALRAENRAHFHGRPGSRAYEWAKGRVVEAFCPAAKAWRESTVAQGMDIIDQAVRMCSRSQ